MAGFVMGRTRLMERGCSAQRLAAACALFFFASANLLAMSFSVGNLKPRIAARLSTANDLMTSCGKSRARGWLTHQIDV